MVEGTGLENRHTGNGIVSSNLTPSVNEKSPRDRAGSLLFAPRLALALRGSHTGPHPVEREPMSSKYILPQELARPPIEETVFEVRFTPVAGDPARIFAVLRGALGTSYPRSEAVPAVHVPEYFRSSAPDPRYEPKLKLMGDDGTAYIGDSAVRLRLVGAYPGWEAVRAKLNGVLDALAASKLAAGIERIAQVRERAPRSAAAAARGAARGFPREQGGGAGGGPPRTHGAER